MRIQVAIPEQNVSADILNAALEPVTRLDEQLIKEQRAPTFDRALKMGLVRWQPEPPGGERFDHAELFALCAQHNAQPFIYDKCGLCRDYADADCEPLPNVGREGHTFAHFAVEYYDRLPQDIILLPGNLGPKHNRLERFKALLQAPRHTTSCEAETTEAEADFTLDVYEGTNMHPASVRPFRKWFERFVGPWDPAPGRGPCWNGIMRTTRERIRAKPRSFYEAILGELAAANSPEAAHFVERSMAAIF